MKKILFILLLPVFALAQVENRIPQYIFKNNLSVMRSANNDTSAAFQIGESITNKGFGLPRVNGTATIIGTPIEGLFLYDLTRKQITYWNGTKYVYPTDSISASGGTTWLQGTGVPSNSLGENGNYYIDTATQNYYFKDGGVWSLAGTMGGSAGLPGVISVLDIPARNAIPEENRYLGMLVFVESEDRHYTLKGGLTNSNWALFETGSTGGSSKIPVINY